MPGGRPCDPPLALFKALLLAQWYRLSDPGRGASAAGLSFRGFGVGDGTPDETPPICRFRAMLAEALSSPTASCAAPIRAGGWCPGSAG